MSNIAQKCIEPTIKIAYLGSAPIDQGTNSECMNESRIFQPHRIRGRGHPYLPATVSRAARSTVEIVITAVPLVILWILMWAALGTGYWIGLLLAVPAAGFLVRLFMIQHDCGHGSFLRGVARMTGSDASARRH